MNKMSEFEKRFNSFDYRLFSDHACKVIAECDQGGLYSWFGDCMTEQDVNAVVEVIWPLCEEEDEE